MNILLNAALDYAWNEYQVFPVNEHTKAPYAEHGMNDATTQTATIRRWWEQHPDALIGCRIPADTVVLDVDPRYGGDEVWAELERAYQPIVATRRHASGRGDGGQHHWFKRPDGKLSARPLHDWAKANGVGRAAGGRSWTSGIDILHHGHRYTILPPSPHPETGRPYLWLDEGEPSLIPPFLAALITAPDPPTVELTSPSTVDDSIADWYSATARWSDILTGWTIIDGDGETDGSKWRHPTATAATSASVRHGCLFVYTPNTDLEETEPGDPHGYTKFRAWAEIHHDGNLKTAAQQARHQRDGTPAELRLAPSIAEPQTPTLRAAQDSDLLDQLINWFDFWNHDHGSEEWIAWPLIPAQRQVALYAPAKSGKSLVTLAVCAAVATGRPILGEPNHEGPRDVLYLDYEMTAADLQERLEALGYNAGDDLSHLHYALLPSLPPLNSDAGSRAIRDLAHLVDAVVVVIDTMGRAVTGEENSPDSYRDFARTTGIMLKAAGRAVLRTDHAGKDKERGQRGSSAKNDDVDVVIRIDPVQDGWTLTRTHSRVAWVPERVTVTKQESDDGLVLEIERGRGRPYAEGTKELVAAMRSLGANGTTSWRAARELITATDGAVKARNSAISDCLRWMRIEDTNLGISVGEQVGERGLSTGWGAVGGAPIVVMETSCIDNGERVGERSGADPRANGEHPPYHSVVRVQPSPTETPNEELF